MTYRLPLALLVTSILLGAVAACSDDAKNNASTPDDTTSTEMTDSDSSEATTAQDSGPQEQDTTDGDTHSNGDTATENSNATETTDTVSTDETTDPTDNNPGTDFESTDDSVDTLKSDDSAGADTGSADVPTDGADTETPEPTDTHSQTIPGVDSDAVVDPTCPSIVNDTLSDQMGCNGVFNAGQVLDYHITVSESDWTALLQDSGPEFTYHQALFSCGDESPITIGIRKKRSGGTQKVGLKIDINEFVDGQRYRDLKKLSFENGVSEGETSDNAEIETYMTEYLAWRLMNRACVMSSRAAFANVYLNGEPLGVYINVEQVDKRFLTTRVGDNNGWLYKKSGSIGDGLKTHETDGLTDPFADYFCFFQNKGCDVPDAETLLTELPGRLQIDQILRMGAVNALMGNTDAPLLKDNNYYYYDWGTGVAPHQRVYFPWDLDTVMNRDYDVFTGTVPGGTSMYTDVLFSNWEGDYRAMIQELATNTNSLEVIQAELENAVAVAGTALAADPHLSGTAQAAADSLQHWWDARLRQVLSQLENN